MSDEETLRLIGERLARVPGIRRVVAFGSRALGCARLDSDLDLMVVAEWRGSLGERAAAIRTQLADIQMPLDLVVYTPEEYERFRRWRSSVAALAEREGRVLCG
jgi:predicted nucleotidyltransferase